MPAAGNDPEALAGFFRRMEFRSLLKRKAAKAATAKTGRPLRPGLFLPGLCRRKRIRMRQLEPVRSFPWLAVPEFQRLTPEELPEFLDGAGEEPVAVHF